MIVGNSLNAMSCKLFGSVKKNVELLEILRFVQLYMQTIIKHKKGSRKKTKTKVVETVDFVFKKLVLQKPSGKEFTDFRKNSHLRRASFQQGHNFDE